MSSQTKQIFLMLVLIFLLSLSYAEEEPIACKPCPGSMTCDSETNTCFQDTVWIVPTKAEHTAQAKYVNSIELSTFNFINLTIFCFMIGLFVGYVISRRSDKSKKDKRKKASKKKLKW
ncbi:hypothetical protein DRJ17_01090 [Candidatus Woesearchaeota archaeon]|mgnify:CR=1 FL=1|nr:MAG: hypothetical protein DRJ17_01090 [Candidatus Woesearchaeota archaeon]